MSNLPQRKQLPDQPSLEHLQKQAKRLVKATPGLQLAAAQHQLAQEYGFQNWAKLAETVETMASPAFLLLKQRVAAAQQSAEEGKPAEALSGLLGCFNEGMKNTSSTGDIRYSLLVGALARLGSTYPPAQQAFRERIGAHTAEVLASPQVKVPLQRFAEGKRLVAEGRSAEALAELLWCFDRGMKDVPATFGIRMSAVLSAVTQLGASYPPALRALCERRDAARLRLGAPAGDAAHWPDFVALNRALGEDAITLSFYDEAKKSGAHVPPALWIRRQLLEAGRHAEVVAIRSFEAYVKDFEMTDQAPLPPELRLRRRVTISGQQLEALAGAGDLAGAQAVVTKMLGVDRSPATLAKLREHANRAGHPELIPAD